MLRYRPFPTLIAVLYAISRKIIVRETRKGNQEWTIQRHWLYWAHKTRRKKKERKQIQKSKTQAHRKLKR